MKIAKRKLHRATYNDNWPIDRPFYPKRWPANNPYSNGHKPLNRHRMTHPSRLPLLKHLCDSRFKVFKVDGRICVIYLSVDGTPSKVVKDLFRVCHYDTHRWDVIFSADHTREFRRTRRSGAHPPNTYVHEPYFSPYHNNDRVPELFPEGLVAVEERVNYIKSLILMGVIRPDM